MHADALYLANLEKQYQTNLQIIRLTNPELYQEITQHQEPNSYHFEFIYHAEQLINIRAHLKDGSNFLLNDTARQKQLHENHKKSFTSANQISCIIGIGRGEEIFLFFETSKILSGPFKGLKEYPLYIVEPDIQQFKLFLTIYDVRDLLMADRVVFFVGNHILEKMDRFFDVWDRRLPQFFYIHQDSHQIHQQIIHLLNKKVDQQGQITKNYLQQLDQFYQSEKNNRERIARFLAKKPEPPLKILVFTSIYTSFLQYCSADLLDGFKDLGCETYLMMENDNRALFSGNTLIQDLYHFKPDMVIMLDHFRWEFPNLPHQIPHITWIQDLLPNIVVEKEGQHLTKNDYIFSFSQKWIRQRDHIFHLPIYKDKTIHFLPIGLNTKVYHPLKTVQKDIDLLYVSHLITDDLTFNPIRKGELPSAGLITEEEAIEAGDFSPEEITRIYTHAIEVLDQLDYLHIHNTIANTPENKTAFAKQILKKAGVKISTAGIRLFSAPIATRLTWDNTLALKAGLMRYLKRHGIQIHLRGANWEQFPELASSAHGPVKSGAPLNELTNRAKIAIHNSGTSFHMRALEILGSGTFLLARRPLKKTDNTRLSDFFEEGKDFVMFDDEKELLQKVNYYLKHEEERETIARQGHETAVNHFSYKQIAQRILDTVREDLSKTNALESTHS
ncbi:glycosyltransferase family protein [Magnetococcales bacterium HHB-1]